MKVFGIVSLLTSCCCLGSLAQMPQRTWESGFSDQYKSENTLGEYTFGYNEDHTTGGSFRRETSDRFGNKMGSYGLRVGDGRVRVVNYVADENGFRADVISNEPGVESQSSNPFSKITKKSIYSILVPGFRYASEAPYVTFQRLYGPASSQVVSEENGPQYESEQRNLDSGEIGDAYINQEQEFENNFSNEENYGNVYSDSDRNFGNSFLGGENGSDGAYTDEEEIYDDEYVDDEYKRASEIVSQNETTARRMDEGLNADATSVVPSAAQNDSQQNLMVENNGNNYNGESGDTIKDLHSSQSKIILSKASGNVSFQGKNGTTLEDTESKEVESTTLQNTTTNA